MNTLYIIKWFAKAFGVFVILPFAALYFMGVLSTGFFSWGGLPYVVIIVAVAIVFGVIEYFKKPIR